jgi:hypothetical protein
MFITSAIAIYMIGMISGLGLAELIIKFARWKAKKEEAK